MKVFIHGTDFHGSLPHPDRFPKGADFLVLTGDMAPHNVRGNFELLKNGFRIINREGEASYQSRWVEKQLKPWAEVLEPSHVIYVPGNHDFFDPTLHFEHTIAVGSKAFELEGVKFGIATGIPRIIGEWNDEVSEYDFNNRLMDLPKDTQMLLTHAGPYGMLDSYGDGHYGFQCYSQAIFGLRMANLEPHFTSLRAAMFGHVHKSVLNDLRTEMIENREVIFSNAFGDTRLIQINL